MGTPQKSKKRLDLDLEGGSRQQEDLQYLGTYPVWLPRGPISEPLNSDLKLVEKTHKMFHFCVSSSLSTLSNPQCGWLINGKRRKIQECNLIYGLWTLAAVESCKPLRITCVLWESNPHLLCQFQVYYPLSQLASGWQKHFYVAVTKCICNFKTFASTHTSPISIFVSYIDFY